MAFVAVIGLFFFALWALAAIYGFITGLISGLKD